MRGHFLVELAIIVVAAAAAAAAVVKYNILQCLWPKCRVAKKFIFLEVLIHHSRIMQYIYIAD
jgi:hypothetical protein